MGDARTASTAPKNDTNKAQETAAPKTATTAPSWLKSQKKEFTADGGNVNMPFEFICKNCLKQGVKTVLYYDESPKIYGMIGYGENSSYLGKIAKLVKACPRCGHKPEFPPETIEVYPIKNNKEKQA